MHNEPLKKSPAYFSSPASVKKTAGVDGKASLSFEERLNLSVELKRHYNNSIHQKLREIAMPKKDGKTRILKVPTIANRAWQCLVKYRLEPALFRNLPRACAMVLEQDA